MMMDNHRSHRRATSGEFCRVNVLQTERHKSVVIELSNLNILEVDGETFRANFPLLLHRPN